MMGFNDELANALRIFADTVRNSNQRTSQFSNEPTKVATKFLEDEGLEIPFGFHAHAVSSLSDLPEEPELATRERYIYVYGKDGEFQFKRLPGSPSGSDDMFVSPKGACQCCNCCVVVL